MEFVCDQTEKVTRVQPAQLSKEFVPSGIDYFIAKGEYMRSQISQITSEQLEDKSEIDDILFLVESTISVDGMEMFCVGDGKSKSHNSLIHEAYDTYVEYKGYVPSMICVEYGIRSYMWKLSHMFNKCPSLMNFLSEHNLLVSTPLITFHFEDDVIEVLDSSQLGACFGLMYHIRELFWTNVVQQNPDQSMMEEFIFDLEELQELVSVADKNQGFNYRVIYDFPLFAIDLNNNLVDHPRSAPYVIQQHVPEPQPQIRVQPQPQPEQRPMWTSTCVCGTKHLVPFSVLKNPCDHLSELMCGCGSQHTHTAWCESHGFYFKSNNPKYNRCVRCTQSRK